jgi:hypothetical protein
VLLVGARRRERDGKGRALPSLRSHKWELLFFSKANFYTSCCCFLAYFTSVIPLFLRELYITGGGFVELCIWEAGLGRNLPGPPYSDA